MGIFIGASPWVFGFSEQPFAAQFALLMGAGIALYSFMTNYEMGVIRLIPFPAHLLLDLIAGILLGGAWLHLAMGGRAAVIFFVLGTLEIATVFLTRRSGPMKTPTMI